MSKELSTIVTDLEIKEKINSFDKLLAHPPRKEWIREHPFIKMEVQGRKTPIKYIPIQLHEELLRKIFQQYKIEVIEWKPVFNAVAVQVRVHYLHPVTSQWEYQDGLGAQEIQTERGASPSDMSKINSYAVMKALPAAESYAVKDACEKIGDIFGGNLNRMDQVAINSPYRFNEHKLAEIQEQYFELEEHLKPEDKEAIEKIIKEKNEVKYGQALNALKKVRNGLDKSR